MAPVRLVLAGAEQVSDRWQDATFHTSFWRIYQADGPGVSLHWAGGRMSYPVSGLICIPGWLRFRFHWRQRVVHRYIHFEPMGWSRDQVETCFPAPFLLNDPDLGRELRRITTGFSAADAWPPVSAWAVQGLACRCLSAAMERLKPTAKQRLSPIGHGRFAAAMALIEDALHRTLSVDELAATAGMRPQPFIRAFRRAHATTPAQFVIERRVARAGRLLLEGELDLPAVARVCGFPNRHYFTRRFTQIMGVGPALFRRRLAGADI